MIHASSSSMIDTNSQGVFHVCLRYASYPNGIQVLPSLTLTKDLKDRYYSVCRKLVRNRPWNGDEFSKNKILGLLSFEKGTQISTTFFTQDTHAVLTERELTRKQYLRSLESRTPEQIAEEEALYLELKRLEQTERQFKKDRDDLLRTLLGIESGLSDIQLGDDSSLHGLSSMPEIKKSKKRTGSAVEIDSPTMGTPSSSIMHSQKRIPPIKNAAYGMFVSSIAGQPCRSYCCRRATLYNTYRSSSNCSDEILSPSGRPPIVQNPNSETGDGREGHPDALRIRHQQFQARHAHPREPPSLGIAC
jgi:hypothetical protein